VCRLNRSLYGLKQAPRAWYSRFASHLLQLGFVEAKSDTSLFIYHRGEDVVYLLLYVDDIVLTASSADLLRRTITSLQQEFSLKDLGALHQFLGMQVQRVGSDLFLSQRQYMIEILDRAGMADCKPCATPVDLNPSCQLMVLLFQIPRIFAVLLVPSSILLSPGQISLMQFSKFVFTCMIPGSLISLL